MIRFAYNTNGAANHRLDDALGLIADAGYDGVALTLDHHHLDPLRQGWERRAEELGRQLETRRLGSVIETGARFLLDPRAKHEPTLITADPAGRAVRVAFLKRAIDIAALLRAEAMSFWAGVRKPDADSSDAAAWLRDGVAAILGYASERGVVAALEPEPGMLVETLDDWRSLLADCPGLRLALDLGHCLVTGEREPAAAVGEFAPHIGTIAIEDMRRGAHVHLPFGEGDMDIPACLQAIQAVGFTGLVCVELSRESHRADTMIPESLRWLQRCRERQPA